MKYQVMPDLTPIEYEALKADIAERGVLVPVEMDEAGDILDGHHRIRAWNELRCEGFNVASYPRIVRKGLTEEQKRNHARSLNVLRRQLSKEQRDEVMRAMRQDGMSIRQIAQAVGVSEFTAHRGVRNITPDFVTGSDGKQYPATKTNGHTDDAPTFDYEAQAEEYAEDESGYGWMTEPDFPSAAASARPHVAYNSGNNEWYTPAEYISAAVDVMHWIDLDPASSEFANTVVKAAQFYTAEDDGLTKDWRGHVWMNPPYAAELIGKFAAKLVMHVRAGDIPHAIVLVNNATETGWFQTMAEVATAICFPRGRVRFWQPSGELGAPLQGQAILYFGEWVDRFRDHFEDFGLVVKR